jgi:hypothetical protein
VHRVSGAALADFAYLTGWKAGNAAQAGGPFMLSVTQYTPKSLNDLPAISVAADRLGDQLVNIDGAVGVLTYFRPARRHIGSLSIWADDRGLEEFMGLPYHVKIMRRYQPRGLPIRSAKWWSDEFEIGAALSEGLLMLDSESGQRVVRPKP